MEDLKKLLAAATPGPWEVSERAKDWRPQVVSTEHGPICTMHIPEVGDADPNAALICAAVNALPELLAIKAERDRAQRACEQMGKRITSLESLISVLLENNPSDAVSDGGHTVLDLWLYHARAALNQEPGQ